MRDNIKEGGFFKRLFKSFYSNLSPDELNGFKDATIDGLRMTFVISRCEGLFPFEAHKDVKSANESIKLKELGNKAFQRGDNKKALELYSESIIRCPENGSKHDISIIRANRSATLYHLEEYELAIKDIDLAISLGYPKEMLYKIKDRKALCLLALKQHKRGLACLRETIVALDDAKWPLERRLKKQKDIEIMTALMLKNNLIDEPIVKTRKCSKLSKKRNMVYKAASHVVNINYNDLEGRFAVAKDDINVGEILLKEKAHCSVLLQENLKTHCFQCLSRFVAAEPCPSCVYVRFCSENCRNNALKTHHGVECKILPTFWDSGASVTCFMALRIITQHPIQYFLSLKAELKEDVGLWLDKEYCGMNYLTVYQLVRHESRRTSDDLLHRAFMATFLLHCLTKAGYFGEFDSLEVKHLIGSLLLRQIQLLQFNAHEISELTGQSENDCKSIFVGAGLYPTLALFNHSCEPSVIRYFEGSTVVARAIKNIKKGEMIAENYGPIFTQTLKQERQLTLKTQYWFDCKCEPCTNNWPMLNEMDASILNFKCETKDCGNCIAVPADTMNFLAHCTKCGQQTNVLKGLKVLQDSGMCFKLANSLSQEGEVEKAIEKFIELHQMLSNILLPPFKDYYLCQQGLKYCFMCLGNRTVIV